MDAALPSTLTAGQFSLVYNMLSLAIASMLASFAFFVMARSMVTAKYRPALVMSSLVVGIAGYHYLRIFQSWDAAYVIEGGNYVSSGKPFNDAYRYVDWLLTVPLLAAELIAVMALEKAKRASLMWKLSIASVLMIALGYPGEVAAAGSGAQKIWGAVSSIPFFYILCPLGRAQREPQRPAGAGAIASQQHASAASRDLGLLPGHLLAFGLQPP
jgi:bacteriorhodopsin